MDLTSIIGIILGIAAVVGGQILEGGSLMAIIQPTAFIIVMGGTAGAVMLSFPGKDLKKAMASLAGVFAGSKENPGETIEMIVNLALKARKEGILALQSDIRNIDDPFMRKGMELMTDGTDPHLLRELLETELHLFEEEITTCGKVWETAGGFTPTVGILGAVLGLIHVMENLNDPSKLGSGIAVAFVATVYGVGFANLIFIPLGTKVKFKGKSSILLREMMIEGILAIQAGESPNFIKEKLRVFHKDGASESAEASGGGGEA
ncbi:MAG: flagellar motor protein [Candidatus Melainabacteria bacterium]|nr:flagellar motor protein [Candidatus Melainabacteria bacterium]